MQKKNPLNLEERLTAAEVRIQSLESKFKASEAKCRWRKPQQMKQQLEEPLLSKKKSMQPFFKAVQPPFTIPACSLGKLVVPPQNIDEAVHEPSIKFEKNIDSVKVPEQSEVKHIETVEKKVESETEFEPKINDVPINALKTEETDDETIFEKENYTEEKKEESVVASNVVEDCNEEDGFESPLVFHLLLMGFDRLRVKKAVELYTDLESALNYLLDN